MVVTPWRIKINPWSDLCTVLFDTPGGSIHTVHSRVQSLILPVVLPDTLQSIRRSLAVLPPKVTYDTSGGITGSQIIRYLGRIDV